MSRKEKKDMPDVEKVICEGSGVFANGLKFVGDNQVECQKCGKGVTIKTNGKLRSHSPGLGKETPEDVEDDEEDSVSEVVVFNYDKASRRASSETALNKDLVPPKYGEPVPRIEVVKGQKIRVIRGQQNLLGQIGSVYEYDKVWGHVTFKTSEGRVFSVNDWDIEDYKNEVDKKL